MITRKQSSIFQTINKSKPKIAGGNALPRKVIYDGVFTASLKIRKGKNRVNTVANTQIAIVITCSVKVIPKPPFDYFDRYPRPHPFQ